MNILLTTPLWSLEEEWAEFSGLAATRSLYSLACLSAYLKAFGHSVTVIESTAFSPEQFRSFVGSGNFGLVGIPSWTLSILKTYTTAKTIKEASPGSKVVIGGVHATVMPERTLRECPHADYVIVGEGEKALHGLADYLASPGADISKVPSLYYRGRNEQSIRHNPKSDFLCPEELPFPDYEGAGIDYFRCYIPHVKRDPTYQLVVNRGCPFHCAFCNAFEVHGHKVRSKPVGAIIEELAYLRDRWGARGFYFQDSTFTFNKKWTYDFCEAYGKRLGLPWSCYTRVDQIDNDLITAMKASGCWQIGFGFESANDRMLESMNKRTTVDQNLAALRLCKKHDISVIASFILGWPGENYESALATVRWAKKHAPNICIFYIPIPYPGTLLHKLAVENNWMKADTGWEMYDPAGTLTSQMPFSNPLIGPARMSRLLTQAYAMYYLSPKSLYHFARRIRSRSQFKEIFPLALSFVRILKKDLGLKMKGIFQRQKLVSAASKSTCAQKQS